jgi:hypothetical protein
MSSQPLKARMQERALAYVCPDCHAEAGARCRSMSPTGMGRRIALVHKGRIELERRWGSGAARP